MRIDARARERATPRKPLSNVVEQPIERSRIESHNTPHIGPRIFSRKVAI